MQYPSGIWSCGERLISADVVLAQPDFNFNLPNIKGIGNDPTAQTLNWPYGVFSDDKSLWIANTGNRRILYYHEIPSENFTPADGVIRNHRIIITNLKA